MTDIVCAVTFEGGQMLIRVNNAVVGKYEIITVWDKLRDYLAKLEIGTHELSTQRRIIEATAASMVTSRNDAWMRKLQEDSVE